MSGIIQKKLRTAGVVGLYLMLRTDLVSRLFPFKAPPILILSYPRSGSSWIGKVLATSTNVAYLREPVTQPYMFKHGGKHAVVDIYKDPFASSIYRKLGDDAFAGRPPLHSHVVNNLHDFLSPQRKGKRILVKEVNPRAVRFYCDAYKPMVLFLLRHPAAIALSFYRLGWLESHDVQMGTSNPSASPWEKFGYAYGTVMNEALESLKTYGNYEVVVYKDIATDPYNGFKKLFSRFNLESPENYDEIIEKYCYSTKVVTEQGEIERTSKNMIFKWQDELTQQQILDLQAGFLHSQLEYYRQQSDWERSDASSYS